MISNNDLHDGLPDKIIRDFLSLSLIKSQKEENENIHEKAPREKDGLDWSISQTKKEIEFQQRHLAILNQRKAVLTVIKSSGWEEWDVSEYTSVDEVYDNWKNFIGTEEEYEVFVTKCKLHPRPTVNKFK